MEIRDPLYGLIKYDPVEEQIINSAPFQRLRGIKQLALASLVYPGAHHTRFEHCIGAMHLAGQVASKLNLKDKDKRTVRLAGLLHDLGHGPFSHVSEQIMEPYAAKLMNKHRAEGAHELMSILLIQKHPDLCKILKPCERESIVELLQKQDKRSLEKDVISGPLDVDKLDYLRRDSYFAGVQYGVFDTYKVIESLTKIEIGSSGTTLGIDEEGVYAVEQLLLAKYHMNAQVYCHRIRRISDAMLVRGIRCTLEEGVSDLQKYFAVDDTSKFAEKYVECDDNLVMDMISKYSKGTAREYLRRICERRLLKEAFCIAINRTNFANGMLVQKALNITEAQRKRLEKEAAKIFSDRSAVIDPRLVIVDKHGLSNPTFKSPKIRIDSSTIMVQSGKGARNSFPEVSSVFSNPAVGLHKEGDRV